MSDSRFPLRTLLFVSVAVNLILISATIGAFASGARLERSGGPVEDALSHMPGPRAFLLTLPPEARRSMRRDFVRTFIAMRDERAEARNARLDLLAATRAEPYDAARVRAAFARVRTADAALTSAFHETLAQELGKLDPAQRRAALDALARESRVTPRGAATSAAPPGPD